MTALAEALLAAQRQAIGALSKAFVAGTVDTDAMVDELETIGCTDVVDTRYLINALDVLKTYGAPAPKPVTPESRKAGTENEPATDAQMKLLRRLADTAGTIAPDYPLTKDTAGKVIDELKAGTYNPDNYTVPF